jgi:hypothetical protein
MRRNQNGHKKSHYPTAVVFVTGKTAENLSPLRHMGETHHGAGNGGSDSHDKGITIFVMRQFVGKNAYQF